MAITNQLGRLTYTINPERAFEGLVAEGRAVGRPYAYPSRREILDIVLGVPADGTYTARIVVRGHPPIDVEVVVDTGELLDQNGDPYDPSVPVTTDEELAEAFVLRMLELPGTLSTLESVTVIPAAPGEPLDVRLVARIPGRPIAVSNLVGPAMAVEFAVLGDPNGDQTITINGTDHTVDSTGLTAEQVEAALLAAINGGAQAGAVTASDGGSGVVLVTTDDPLVPFTYAIAGGGTATVAVGPTPFIEDEQAAGGDPIPVGRWLVFDPDLDGGPGVRLPESTDAAASLIGVLLRSHSNPTRPDQAQPTDGPLVLSGSTMTPADSVICWLRNAGNVAASAGGQVYAVIDGALDRGASRADADGGNAVAPTLVSARWLEPTAAGALGRVRVALAR